MVVLPDWRPLVAAGHRFVRSSQDNKMPVGVVARNRALLGEEQRQERIADAAILKIEIQSGCRCGHRDTAGSERLAQRSEPLAERSLGKVEQELDLTPAVAGEG